MLSKKILFFLVAGLCHAYILTASSIAELTDFQKDALAVAKAAYEVDNIQTRWILTFKDNVFDADGKFIEQRWSIEGVEGDLSNVSMERVLSLKMILTPSTPSTIQMIASAPCWGKKTYYLGAWEGKITRVTLDKRGNFSFEKDAQGNVTRLANSNYEFVKKLRKESQFRKIRYDLTYADNKVTSIEEYIMIGEGPDYKNIKEESNKKERSKTITYKGNGMSRTVRTIYYQSSGLRDDSYTYQFDNGVETRTEMNNVIKEAGSTDRFTRNQKNQIIKWERNLRTKFNEFESMELAEYNNENRIIKLTATRNVDKKFESHRVTDYTYKPADPTITDRCDQPRASYYTRSMDVNGNVIEERADGKYRVKTETGDWTEWKFSQY
jgi:hypothetical protein